MPQKSGDKPLMQFDKKRSDREMARTKPGAVYEDVKSSVKSIGRRAINKVRSLAGGRR